MNKKSEANGPLPQDDYAVNPLEQLNNIVSHHLFQGALDAAREGCHPLDTEKLNQSAIGYAADHLKKDIHFQSNLGFINAVQKQVPRGLTSTKTHGLSIHQIRFGDAPNRRRMGASVQQQQQQLQQQQ